MSEYVEPENAFYWQAFHMLRGSRSVGGMGIGAIPLDAILGYADLAGMTCPVEKTRLARIMIMMDNAERSQGAENGDA
ncbi:MAG: hypothetical protein Unbinned7865contig1001_60 [Prokaryotic dsDNA virus sp.]|nr:MAG: hypothetical protein Unbinned7865contig1001_60 [Prokaryotic dsDNA virus sp.]|tara:strand:- start:8784 stop:9017 length:234 start_codon:yes stop_codon:yes gene_type:complete